MRVVPVMDEQGSVVRWYGTNTDIDDLKQAQSALTASEQLARGQVEALVQSLDVLAAAPDPDQLIVEMLSTIGRLLKSRWVTLWLLDETRESLVLRANVRDSAQVPADDHPYVSERSAWKADLAIKELFFTREPVVCEDLKSDARVPASVREFFRTHGIEKLLRLPTLVGGEVKGFITIGHGKREPYRATEVELAQALAHQAMLALQTGQAATWRSGTAWRATSMTRWRKVSRR
jgi:GAF domain-containing protein